MADDDERAAAAIKIALQPFDRGEIEMIGRLIQQQDIRRGRHDPRQRRAAALASGQLGGVIIAMQPELLQNIPGLIAIVTRTEPRFDIGQRGGEARKVRLLRQVANGGPGLHETAAAVRFDCPGGDLQQRRFPRAVAPDQAYALA